MPIDKFDGVVITPAQLAEEKFGPRSTPVTFNFTTDGTTGREWVAELRQSGYCFSNLAKQTLEYDRCFASSNGVLYRLIIILGTEFKDSARTNQYVIEVAKARGYLEPPLEFAPYVRQMFSGEDLERMGLRYLIVMHKPVSQWAIRLGLMHIQDEGLGDFEGDPDRPWDHMTGFVFMVPVNQPATSVQ